MITRNTPKVFVEKLGKKCKSCGHCCSYGTGYLEPNDVTKIANHLNMREDDLKNNYLEEVEVFHTTLLRPKKLKKPYGACVFLRGKKCSIHKVKPLHCKIANCSEHGDALHQWFMLNYAVNPEDPQSVREWAQFLEFKQPIPGGDLHDLVKSKSKLKKMLSYEMM
jgi:Fe-S-cluster containining protein